MTIIIPTFNRAHAVQEAVDSALAQTRCPNEVVVVDDGSTDNTLEMLGSYDEPVRCVSQANSGASVARNLGILRSSGDYILFLDSDDVLLPEAVAKLAGALDTNGNCGAAYCGWLLTTGPGGIAERSPLDRPSGMVLREMCVEHLCVVQSVMVRRECLSKAGLFESSLAHFEDIDFWARVAEHYPFVFVPEHLVEYRRWGEGASDFNERLWDAGQFMLGRLFRYRREGRLTAEDWRAVDYRFRGFYRERHTANAFRAYFEGDWRTAYRSATKGFWHYPSSILNRGVWAVLVKSCWRACRRGAGP